MYYPTLQPKTTLINNRTLASTCLAAMMTFGIFVVMDKLTHFDGQISAKPEALPEVTVVFDHEDPELNRRQTLPKIEPPVIKPPMQSPDLDMSNDLDGPGVQFNVALPQTDLSDTGLDGVSMQDGYARPLVRMAPQYPMKAAQDGIEGWVKLIFTIDASGAVKDIEVVDAEPKRIFNQAARRALSKWKYKPQMIAGKPVAQEGFEVVLDFNLNQG